MKNSGHRLSQQASLVGTAPPCAPTPQNGATLGPTASPVVVVVDAQATSAQIKSLESALALIPPGELFETSRSAMRGQIASLKMSMTKAKPLGVRLENCKAAVLRAARRKEEATAAVAAAVAAEKLAVQEHAQYLTELTSLETELSASVGSGAQPADCVQNMSAALQRVVGEMKDSPLVPPDLIKQAEAQMALLLDGVKHISTLASQAAQARQPKITVPTAPQRPGGRKRANSEDQHRTRNRMRGKQEVLHECSRPMPLDPVHRMVGKQIPVFQVPQQGVAAS